ncbi:MAG: hypothetical protein PVJ02_02260 [Gemmatimonadota bacterium]|jgi:hypothetical protein
MKKTLLALGASALLALPGPLAAQGFGVAGRVGTLGIGVEGALGLADRVVLRGGIGLMPLELDATNFWDPGQDVNAKVKLPGTWYNIGADLYLGGSFRVGAGMLYKPDNPTLTGTLAQGATIEIGGQEYTSADLSKVSGALDSGKSAPYLLVGFGKHTSTGIGLFVDLGVAFLGDPNITLAAEGNSEVINTPEFQQRLREEEQNIESDVGAYLKYWPILDIGVRFGIG